MEQRTFDLPAGCTIQTVTLRETNGKDEKAAHDDAKTMKIDVTEAMIRRAVVEIDGNPVSWPVSEFESWNTKTRVLVARAFHVLNGTTDEELADFLASSKPKAAPPTL